MLANTIDESAIINVEDSDASPPRVCDDQRINARVGRPLRKGVVGALPPKGVTPIAAEPLLPRALFKRREVREVISYRRRGIYAANLARPYHATLYFLR